MSVAAVRVIHLDEKEGVLKVEPQSLEDLWYLKKIIDEGDLVRGRSWRRFKTGDKLRPEAGEKKAINVEVRVSAVEFAEAANRLRVTGKITQGEPEEFVQVGEHHTIDVEPHDRLEVRKKLSMYHKKILEEAKKKAKKINAIIVVMDEEKAGFCFVQPRGMTFPFEITNTASKRDPKSFEELTKKYFNEILGKLAGAQADRLIVAGPGFAKDNFRKFAEQKDPALVKRMWFEHASTAERTGAYELLKKGVLERILGEHRVQEEFSALERLKASLGREDRLSCYGLDEVEAAVAARAADTLLVLDELARANPRAEKIMQAAEAAGAKIILFDSEDDAGAEFKAFRIAAMLRYRLK
ncbi:MAG: mRNA surveillance protein pelota [Candidatus Micrarchaeota archaeon]|nr:mRNA surveillance protein pelota [Candidatus Micrarchaeota archaeon]